MTTPIATALLAQLQLDGPFEIRHKAVATGRNPIATRRELFVTARLHQLQLDGPVATRRKPVATVD